MTTQERTELAEIRRLLELLVAALRGVPGSAWPSTSNTFDGVDDSNAHISASRGRRWS